MKAVRPTLSRTNTLMNDDDDNLRNHDEKEHKRHDLAIEKLQITTDELDKSRMK